MVLSRFKQGVRKKMTVFHKPAALTLPEDHYICTVTFLKHRYMKNKALFLLSMSALFFASCTKNADLVFPIIDFSGPCKATTTMVNLKVVDAYSNETVSGQKFDLWKFPILYGPDFIETITTTDSVITQHTFTQDPNSKLAHYYLESDKDNTYFALMIRKYLSVGCSNDVEIVMKKKGQLELEIENRSGKGFSKSTVEVFIYGNSIFKTTLDTIPLGNIGQFTMFKVPEERVIVRFYNIKDQKYFQDISFDSSKDEKEVQKVFLN
jgi:hypothetical protein